MPDDPPVKKDDNSPKDIQPRTVSNKPARRRPTISWQSASKMNLLNVLLISVVLLVAVALYLGSRTGSAETSKPSTELVIVQLNDIYRLDAVRAGKRGGLARVVSLIRRLKEQNSQVIVLHAGDFLAPSLESDVFHGSQMIDAMNFINDIAPLYAVPGNHEFDYKDTQQAFLTDAIEKSKFQWIASNIERNDPALLSTLKGPRINQHLLVTYGKVKLGIFGLTIDAAHDGKDQTYAPLSGDYERIAREEIEYLEGQGADLIVGLTHLNIEDDQKLAKLKQQHPRFMWIAGGHEHALDREPAWTNGALITKGDSNARTVWKVSVIRNGQNVELHEESIPIDGTTPADPVFAQDIENFYRTKLRNVRPYLDTKIVDIPSRCYDGTEEAVRERESDWGDYLTDTMRKMYPGVTVDVAVLNGGTIRIDDSICERITFENLERTFAYDAPIVLVKLKGEDLRKQILEASVGSKRGDGRFLQVSGVSFRRDFSKKGGEILQDLQLDSAKGPVPFSDTQTYVVAVNRYIFGCGDDYHFRQYVTEYIDGNRDLRTFTYAALAGQTKSTGQTLARISDLPEYVKLPSQPVPTWQTFTDKQCPAK
jgi:5'-nucleotidase